MTQGDMETPRVHVSVNNYVPTNLKTMCQLWGSRSHRRFQGEGNPIPSPHRSVLHVDVLLEDAIVEDSCQNLMGRQPDITNLELVMNLSGCLRRMILEHLEDERTEVLPALVDREVTHPRAPPRARENRLRIHRIPRTSSRITITRQSVAILSIQLATPSSADPIDDRTPGNMKNIYAGRVGLADLMPIPPRAPRARRGNSTQGKGTPS